MINTTILIKLSNNVEDDVDEIKLLENKLRTAVRCYDSNVIVENEGVYFIDIGKGKIIELYRKKKKMWLINMYGHTDKDKCRLIDTISKDDTFESIIIIFDSISNIMLRKQYPIINKMENNLRSEFCYKIINNWKVDIFEVIDKLNVKEEFRFDHINIPENMNTKLQRYELIDLIEYMNDHRLGGDEFNSFYKSFKSSHSKDKYDDFESLLKTNIFNNISNKITNVDKVRRIRNIICHNNIVNIEKFTDSMNNIKIMCDGIEKLYIEDTEKIFGYNIEKKRDITFIIHQDSELVNQTDIKLKFSELLNYCGYIYDNRSGFIMKSYPNGNVDLKFDKQCTGDGVSFLFRYKLDNENKSSGVYLFSIVCDDTVFDEKIAAKRDNLIKHIKSSNIIVINDYISRKYCEGLYGKINFIENIVRAYISIFYFFKGLDINKIKIKGKSSANNDGLTLNNNKLYDCDFIELVKILDNPPESKKVSDLSNELLRLLNSSELDRYRIIENKLKNISDTNADVIEVLKVWLDLYKYRTVVSHSEYISLVENATINELIQTTLEKVEKIFFNEIENTFNIGEKYKESSEFKFSNNISMKIDLRTNYILFRLKEHMYEFQEIGISRFARFLNSLLEDKKEIELTYIFTVESLKQYINKNKEKLNELLETENYDTLINKKITELDYTKYSNYRVISSRDDILEERIGILLKSIEDKINEIEEEICATKV